MTTISVRFGAMAPTIAEQIPQLKRADAKKFQAWSDAVSTCAIVGLITWAERKRAYDRLLVHIKHALENKKDSTS